LGEENYPTGCSKSLFSKAAGESKPEAYPQGYVEDFDEPRTKLADFFSIRIKGIILADGWNARQLQVGGDVRHRVTHLHERRIYGSSSDDCRSFPEDWFVKVRPSCLRDSPAQYRPACEPGRDESLGRVQSSWRARWPGPQSRRLAEGLLSSVH